MKRVFILSLLALGLTAAAFAPVQHSTANIQELTGGSEELTEVSSFTKFEERATNPDKTVWAHRVETWDIGGNTGSGAVSNILSKY